MVKGKLIRKEKSRKAKSKQILKKMKNYAWHLEIERREK